MLTSFADVVALLQRQNAPHRANPEQSLVELPVKNPPLEGWLVVRWEKQGLVQFIVVLDMKIEPARMAAAESAVARMNHALILPGFGLNHATGALYYRIVLPRHEDKMSEDDFTGGLRVALNNARDFFLSFRGVIVDGKPPESVLGQPAGTTPAAPAPSAPPTPATPVADA